LLTLSVDIVNKNDYYQVLPAKELKRLLRSKGCTFKAAKGHEKVYLGSRMTVLPRHGTDIGPFLLNKILKDLGVEKEK
jgi:predicted RNA binding protein YcfA (HicA-like mRNA interferase family)